jgi:hypothetical protein
MRSSLESAANKRLETMNVACREVSAGELEPLAVQGITRTELLLPLYRRLAHGVGVRAGAALAVESESAETLAPHQRLRQILQADPAMGALLPGAAGRFALGGSEHIPFAVIESGLILLPPVLLDDGSALAAAARWGLEAAHARENGPVGKIGLAALVRHGRALVGNLPTDSRELLLSLLPAEAASELFAGPAATPSPWMLAWQAGLVCGADVGGPLSGADQPSELELPIEQILVAGGDSRLTLERDTGRNRYGVPPRPRPEAVHFSSSTASAVSDYGFLYCDLLRRDMLSAYQTQQVSLLELRRRAAHATGAEINRLLGLTELESDVALAPSGTDTELLAVMVARAGSAGRPLVNILIAPEETGRGVRLAGSGCFFDSISATGAPIVKGTPVCADGVVPVLGIAIRDDWGRPRDPAAVDAEFLRVGRAALDDGCHLLAHVLLASKTGLSAPSRAAVDALVALAPSRVDVVVDACQMRTPFKEMATYVQHGWMLQVSGSKFLTGPPFSGALVVPAVLRSRAAAVGFALAAVPEVGHATDWTVTWASQMTVADDVLPSFGLVFRWLPALLEAELLGELSESFRGRVFERFRAALTTRMNESIYIQPIDVGDDGVAGGALARLSIMSFQVLGRNKDGSLKALDEGACRHLFEALNRDVTPTLDALDPTSAAVARQQAHIGQPVTLGSAHGEVTVLRMVLGARFFTIIGYAGAGAIEAALMSEIADARRAIAKVELLAEHWWRFDSDRGE